MDRRQESRRSGEAAFQPPRVAPCPPSYRTGKTPIKDAGLSAARATSLSAAGRGILPPTPVGRQGRVDQSGPPKSGTLFKGGLPEPSCEQDVQTWIGGRKAAVPERRLSSRPESPPARPRTAPARPP